jgi:hypothetical protein
MEIHLPPFTMETALEKVQIAQDIWNTKDPDKICLMCTPKTEWRYQTEFINGQEEVKQFLKHKWLVELDFSLKNELWGFRNYRMAVRVEYEWHNQNGEWYRSFGNELWEFDDSGLLQKRFVSTNDLRIKETDRIINIQ